MASLPVMNLSLGSIITVEAIFSYVIWGQELAEELSAIRVSDRSSQANVVSRSDRDQDAASEDPFVGLVNAMDASYGRLLW